MRKVWPGQTGNWHRPKETVTSETPDAMPTRLLIAALLAGLTLPAAAEDRPIRNAPSPRSLEFAAYIYSAQNVCGYRIGVPAFEAELAKQGTKPEDVNPRGPFGRHIAGMFSLMSNQIQLNREAACLAVAGEFGPEGKIAKNVLLPAGADDAPAAPKPGEPEAASPKPAE